MATAAGPSASTQTNRHLKLFPAAPLKEDDLYLTDFAGLEQMSRLFSFQLRMFSEKKRHIKPDEIVGKNVTFSVLRHTSNAITGNGPAGELRHFNGYISRFTAGGVESGNRTFTAEVVPWLWFLTQTSDCRIFQDASIPDILDKIFDEHKKRGIDVQVDSQNIKRAEHRKWEYCVQYRETDFNFVSRLMEQAGIYYYFKHEKGKHTLVLSDNLSGYKKLTEYDVPYLHTGGITQQAHISSWEHQYEFCSGKWVHTDYNFLKSKVDLSAQANQNKSVVPLGDAEKYELFDYPGEYPETSDGDRDAEIRQQEEESTFNVARGGGYCRTFSPGGLFKLKGHPARDSEDGEYLITSIQHSAHDPSYVFQGGRRGTGDSYSNDFSAIPSRIVFRPARTTPKPLVSGVQTAVVVGKKGDEIHTDEHGRVKVHFFWDRELPAKGDKRKDEEKSCWIRVAHNIAGKNWGFFSIPRIGQEVVVDFLEGDPDRPLIIGSVYNDKQTPHYDPEQHKTKSYIKTNSSLGGDGFNELRFEDKKKEEQIFIHAERNMDVRVKNDSMETISGNRHQIIGWEKDGKKGGDQNELVHQDKHLTIKRDQVEHIEGNYLLMVGNGDAPGGGNVDIVLERRLKVDVRGDEAHLNFKGDKFEKIGAGSDLTVDGPRLEKLGALAMNIGSEHNVKVGTKSALEAGEEIHLKSGMKLIIEAGTQLTLKVGGNFVDISPAGVNIQGTLVNINSGGAPGTGKGADPAEATAPKLAKEAKPTKPAAADNARSGQKSSS